MYDVHLGLIGKRIVDFLLMLIELFFATLSRYERKEIENRRFRTNAVSLILQVEGVAPPIIFSSVVTPMNALQLCR